MPYPVIMGYLLPLDYFMHWHGFYFAFLSYSLHGYYHVAENIKLVYMLPAVFVVGGI